MTPDATLLFHLRTVGVLMALLAIVNLFVPGRFNWREELSRVRRSTGRFSWRTRSSSCCSSFSCRRCSSPARKRCSNLPA